MRKIIAVTMGDPAGVGPEIIVRAVSSREVLEVCRPIVIGSSGIIEKALKLVDLPLSVKRIDDPKDAGDDPATIFLIEVAQYDIPPTGMPTDAGGKAAYSCVKKAVDLAMDGKVSGIVTAPLSKEALKLAGLKWPGHTEMLAELTGASDYAMVLVGGPLRVILVTIHTAISSVPPMITRDRVLKTILLGYKACRMMGITSPRIAVAGLNPHAGEAGMFGDEETKEILPAIEDAKRAGAPAEGPFPPDTVFHKAYNGFFDMIVCMYHDQGLIPLKMIAFDKGVNMTVGLPIVRTSPDHGTAYDIAWKGIADPSSMIEAIRLAASLEA